MATIQVELISTAWVDIPDDELKAIKEEHPDWGSYEIIEEWKSDPDNYDKYLCEALNYAELQEDNVIWGEWDDGTAWKELV